MNKFSSDIEELTESIAYVDTYDPTLTIYKAKVPVLYAILNKFKQGIPITDVVAAEGATTFIGGRVMYTRAIQRGNLVYHFYGYEKSTPHALEQIRSEDYINMTLRHVTDTVTNREYRVGRDLFSIGYSLFVFETDVASNPRAMDIIERLQAISLDEGHLEFAHLNELREFSPSVLDRFQIFYDDEGRVSGSLETNSTIRL